LHVEGVCESRWRFKGKEREFLKTRIKSFVQILDFPLFIFEWGCLRLFVGIGWNGYLQLPRNSKKCFEFIYIVYFKYYSFGYLSYSLISLL
jgi:hypothetical protein